MVVVSNVINFLLCVLLTSLSSFVFGNFSVLCVLTTSLSKDGARNRTVHYLTTTACFSRSVKYDEFAFMGIKNGYVYYIFSNQQRQFMCGLGGTLFMGYILLFRE